MMIPIDILLTYGAVYKKYSAGEVIFKEGNYCSFYYQIISGRVLWANINAEGKEFLQDLVEPGSCVGELPLFDGEPYAASAIAENEVVVLRLHQNSFHQLLKENTDIHFSFSKLLAGRVRFKFYMLKEITCHDPEIRIKSLIKYLQQNHTNICSRCQMLKLTRQQIADMTGLRVETVIRAMRQMHEKGEIKIEKGKVYCGSGMTEIIPQKCTG